MHINGLNKDELIEENRALNMLMDIANAILTEHDLNLALKHCLSIICIGLRYPVGHIYFVDDEGELLMPSDLWFLKEPSKTPAFYAFTMKSVLRYSEDIVGRVLSSGEPCFIEDVCKDHNFLRTTACQSDNLHSAIAFPVDVNGKIAFVIEFFTHEYKKQDPNILLLINRLSAQLSCYLFNKQQINELEKHVAQLRYAVGSGKVGVWEYDPKNEAITWDEQMFLMYGIVPLDFEGTYRGWERALHPEDKKRAANEFKKALANNHKFDTEFRIITPTGNVRHIHATAKIIRAPDGSPKSVFGINIDITQEKTLILDLSKKTEEMEKMNHVLKKHAYFDPLTGLMNRNSLKDNAVRYLARGRRIKSIIAVLFIDLDDFKKINDSLGHTTGDLVLIETANRFKRIARKEDIIARIGGDEFIQVVELKNTLSGTKQANKIINAINKPFQINDKSIQINASIGIAFFPADGNTFKELIAKADIALLKAKELGKNKIIVYGFWGAADA